MNQAPEEVFYAAQQSFAEVAKPSSETARLFREGGRYSIVAESLRHNPLKHRNSIVELGCGKGDKLLFAKEHFAFARGAGIDLCFSQRVSVAEAECEFYSANLNQPWPLEDASTDVLIAMMLLEHLFDPYASFREIRRVLSPSGRAFVNLPLVTSIKNRTRLLFGKIPVTSVPYQRWQPEGHWDGFHLHYFTLESIGDLALCSGLKVTKVSPVGKFYQIKKIRPSLLCDEISFELVHNNI